MDINDTSSDLSGELISTAETVAAGAFFLRNKIGLTPGADGVAVEVPKPVVETGPRVSPDEWDKSVRSNFEKAPAESVTVEKFGRLQPEKDAPPMPKAVKASDTLHAAPPAESHELARTREHTVAAKAEIAAKPALEVRASEAVTAKSSSAAAKQEAHVAKSSSVAVKQETHVAKSTVSTAVEKPHASLSVAKPLNEVHIPLKTLPRAETLALEQATKESANLALKSVLRTVAGPEVAIGVAVASAVPEAYRFVDEASGHAISKSSVGQAASRLAEHSGANAAAHKIGGMVEHASDSAGRVVASAMAKTGADKALEKASEMVGRAGKASGVFGGFAKVGAMWDAGAAKLEKVIHDNVHGPDNPAHKVVAAAAVAHAAHPAAVPAHPAPAASHAAVPAHPATPAPTAVKTSSATEGTHTADKGAIKGAPTTAHKTVETHAPVSHNAATTHKSPGHEGAHVAHSAPVAHSSHAAHHKAPSDTPVATVVKSGAALKGAEGLSKALEGHMDTHGMSSQSKELADPLGEALATFLAESPNSSTSLVINPNSDAIATMSEPGTTAPVAGDLPAISSKTLEAVAETGISQEGVSQLRENMPAEVKGKSDLELADIVGVAAISNIGEKGVNVPAVDKMQEHISRTTEGTEFSVTPDRLSTVKALYDMGEQTDKNFAVIEGSAAGTRLIGAMSESQFNAHPETPGATLAAVDVSGMRKELSLPEAAQAQQQQQQQQKSEAKAPEPAMER